MYKKVHLLSSVLEDHCAFCNWLDFHPSGPFHWSFSTSHKESSNTFTMEALGLCELAPPRILALFRVAGLCCRGQMSKFQSVSCIVTSYSSFAIVSLTIFRLLGLGRQQIAHDNKEVVMNPFGHEAV